ncbi:hypothetical protein BDR26DRAFT_853401 [Obelidium mucronatum]|nr:hypothetical protein BDR26DRAFT_853401 [Obelidium mucronatum]
MVQTQATSTNLFHEATLSAASFDNSSAECKGGKCKVFAIANDGVGQSADDRTFYQSASDSSCANQWVQADFEVPATMIENFTIQYDTFGWTFQGSKNYFQVLLNPNSSSPIDFSSSTSCVISNVTNTNIVSRLDTCTFSKQPTTAVNGVRFTWGLEMPSGALSLFNNRLL